MEGGDSKLEPQHLKSPVGAWPRMGDGRRGGIFLLGVLEASLEPRPDVIYVICWSSEACIFS